jgi:4-diphosphocytidyl-2-C-methyl-D-erythritol kinase
VSARAGLATRCYAKVNLTLEALGRRPDGYHDLASLVHTVDLADELAAEPADAITLAVSGEAPTGDANLVARAAAALAGLSGTRLGARLTLRKCIPAAAGLGGGSSDAASALLLLDQLWGTHRTPAELAGLALGLGSDVPFLLRGGAAVVRGRGEIVRPTTPWLGQWLVLVAPQHQLEPKTATLFGCLGQRDFSDGRTTERAAARLAELGHLDDADLTNAFAPAARAAFAGLDDLWCAAERLGSRPFHLTGAGPGLFALAPDEADARALAGRLGGLGARVYAVRTVVPPAADRYAGSAPIGYA